MNSSLRKRCMHLLPVAVGFLSILLMIGLAFRVIVPAFATATVRNLVTPSASHDWYTPGGWAPWGTAFDKSGNVWLALPGCDPSPMCSNSTPPGEIAVFNPQFNAWPHLYQLPAGYGQPLFLAFDQSGKLWFPMPMTNTLGMLDPSTGTFQQWVVPSAGSGPWGVAVDHQGYIWFTEHYANKIGRFDPNSQSFMEISTPALNSQPYGITVDASNNIWFTENNDSVALIGEYSAGTLKEYKIRNSSTTGTGLTPHLLTVDPQGNIWWSEGWVHMIGQLIVSQAVPGTNDGVTEFGYTPSCSSCGSHTSGIGADSNGQIWFDDSLQSIFGVFSAGASGTFTLFNTPTANSHPHDGLNVDANNTVWFDEEFANKLAEAPQGSIIPTPTASLVPTLTPSSTPTATPSPTPGTVLGQDTFQRANQKFWGKASNGNVWGSDAGTNSVFSISSNSGRVINGAGNYSAILGASTSNADVVFSGSLSSFTNTNLGATLRWHDGNNWYKAYLDGKNLVIQKKVSGTGTMIASIPFAASGGTSYSIRFEVVGTTLSARAWATGSTEPSAWQVTGTDSTFTSGYCGLRMLVQGGATATFTSFTATGL